LRLYVDLDYTNKYILTDTVIGVQNIKNEYKGKTPYGFEDDVICLSLYGPCSYRTYNKH